jgi:membrane protease YdiL (CAAX protease family)
MLKQNITPLKASLIFTGFTGYFFLLLFTLLPLLKANISLNPALYWFITGYSLFIPMFVYALTMAKRESGPGQAMTALGLRPFNSRDWKYSIAGLALSFVATGIIFGGFFMSHRWFGTRMLSTTPWFMQMEPFHGPEKLYLLIWLPMFFFNIVGEELLWRGYIQNRMAGKYAWLLCSFLWMIFHLPFGPDLMIMLIPVMLIIPYVFHKTKNSLTGIFIHGIFNGPIFIAVALGFMK